MDNKIILEDRFTTHQKIHIILVIGTPLILIIFFLIQMDLNYKGYLFLLLFIMLYLMLVCFSFTKRGLLKVDTNLYRGLFFYDKLISKTKINLEEKTKISVLKFKKFQKTAWFTVAKPDLGLNFNTFDINLLNDSHTIRNTLISLQSEVKSKETIEFLSEKFNLKYEIYNPDFGN